MFKNYLITAWRSLWRNKITTFINLCGLSVGMTAAVLILLWVQNEINFDDYHPDAANIYRLTSNQNPGNWIWESTPLLLAEAAKKEIPAVDKIARLNVDNAPVINISGNYFHEKKCAYVDDDWFNIFHYQFLEGSAISFGQNLYSVILSSSEAKKYFGYHKALGASIHINGLDYQVKAIVADAPPNSSFQYNMFLPLADLLTNRQIRANDEQWGNYNYITFIKLKSPTSSLETAKKLTNILQKNGGDKESKISLISLKNMHFENHLQTSVFAHGNRTTVSIFTLLAFILLLVACINYVNLTTAKASLRAREVSIRKMIGAKHQQLFYQFIAESAIVSLISMIITLLLVQLSLPLFNSFTGKHFDISFASLGMWSIISITLFSTLLLNSIYPALLLSSFNPLNVFRGVNLLNVKDTYLRKGLVIFQFTISVILISGTIVIYKQMSYIQQSNQGYNKEQILFFPFPANVDNDKRELLMQTIKMDLLEKNSIQSITLANQPIVNIGSISTGNADWDGHDISYNPKIIQLSADADFHKTMELKMKEGRWFQQENQTDKNNVILNETAVNELNIHKPVINQRFTFKGRTGQIVGVVKDFHCNNMHERIGALVAFNDPEWYRFFMARINPNNVSQAIAAIQNSWRKIVPGNPLEYNFLDDTFNEQYKEDQQTAVLIFVFAGIAIIIAALGLFGLAAFVAQRKLKEIGIRKVLGATVANLVILISKGFLLLVSISIALAIPIAWWVMNKWLENFAYKINISWWMFAFAGVTTLLIALITVSFQAVKAALANPVKSLRSE